MHADPADLVNAIPGLGQGIASLNREGRERLLAAFEAVNTHFQELFVRLFGGGRAHLKLTESEDPLAAGLEIMASPPGKRLQVMSLLSGGEQALTALALLFGVFLTNPAPRSEEHTSELQSLMRIPYADVCLKQKIQTHRYN